MAAGMCVLPSGATAQNVWHYRVAQSAGKEFPRKLVLLPPEVDVFELSAGGTIEKVPEWGRQAAGHIEREIREFVDGRRDLELVPMATLSEDEKELVERHFAAYTVVATTAHAILHNADPAWAHKRNRFDYTIGPGLRFLKEKTGADAAILAVAEDLVSSGGRKAMVVLGALLGIGLPTGRAYLVLAVVELESGDIVWLHSDFSVTQDLKDGAAVEGMIIDVLRAYERREPAK
jgi:hypothetical protein